MKHISVILPSYNEEASIAPVIQGIHATLKNEDYEIIVVDDGSTDKTMSIAMDNNARVVKNPYNIGNGAAIKAGIRASEGSILVFMDSDGQHDPEEIPKLLKLVGPYDMVVGARMGHKNSSAHRRWANIFYNYFASYMIGRKIYDLTSGFRAIKAEVAKKFSYLLPNTFSYPSTITMALFRAGYSVKYIPIEARKRVGTSKINIIRDGTRFVLIIIKIATFFSPLRVFVPVSLSLFTVGVGYALFKIIVLHTRYTPFSVLLINTSVIIFFMGLISEQIAQLRFEKSENR